MQALPLRFIERLSDRFGPEISSRAVEALGLEPSVSVRFNPAKMTVPEGSERVQWSPFGVFLPERPSFTLDPLFHAGAYYVQDSSAMMVGEVFRRASEGLSHLRVLDLCAAPGGKTTDIATSLQSIPGSVLVANEVMSGRAGILRENVTRWGDPSVVVTSVDPSALGALSGYFDIVVADVPCSGEGMFRKDEGAVRDWSEDNVRLCAARQRRIIADIWPALTFGGILIYSTCTFSREENDDNVRWICETLGAEVLPLPSWYEGPLATESGLALIPGLVKGEGQWVAALRKTAPSESARIPRRGRPDAAIQSFKGLVKGEFEIVERDGRLFAMAPAVMEADLLLRHLRPLLSGVCLGQVKGQDFVPSPDLSLCTALSPDAFPAVDLGEEDALRFLHLDPLSPGDYPRGYLTMNYRGVPLGFVKNLGTRLNNLHPQSRRIRMDITK